MPQVRPLATLGQVHSAHPSTHSGLPMVSHFFLTCLLSSHPSSHHLHLFSVTLLPFRQILAKLFNIITSLTLFDLHSTFFTLAYSPYPHSIFRLFCFPALLQIAILSTKIHLLLSPLAEHLFVIACLRLLCMILFASWLTPLPLRFPLSAYSPLLKPLISSIPCIPILVMLYCTQRDHFFGVCLRFSHMYPIPHI